jgi:serine/threonine-protein kinase HipA
MTVFIGSAERDQGAFRVRAHRGQLRKLYRNVYTDDFQRPAEAIVRENILAIAAGLLPDWQLSHSSAAVREPMDGLVFMSGAGKPGRNLDLPGVKIVRMRELAAPEYDRIPTPTEVVQGVDRPPETLYLRVSTALQTIFECLTTARSYPQKNLPDAKVAEMISRLPASDRERAERFAVRNGLRREYLRYQELSFGVAASEGIRLAEPDAAEIYFFGWKIGTLTYLGGGEYRFAYDPQWPVPLSLELPLERDGISYEGRRMPAFFENCLPEGWTESVVLASNKLSREDLFGLFSTTRKYLSNLTLRPLGIPEAELAYDAHTLRLERLGQPPGDELFVREYIGAEPDDPNLWRKTRTEGPLRISGVQAKLPVSLFQDEAGLAIRIGDLRHACTHILKVPVHEYPGLIENEWATMELARRIGLPVARVALLRFQPESRYRGRSLLVERYDIPDLAALDAGAQADLILQEDACSLLLLRRHEKYQTSMERIADALLAAGLGPDDQGMLRFLQLTLFSWIVGNGDLHAKNVSVLRRFRPGRPGEAPVFRGVELAPFYDLVSTRLHIRGDDFALPVDGRRANIRLKNLVALASRWQMPRDGVRSEAETMAHAIRTHLDSVLAASPLPQELVERYRSIVGDNLDGLGL